MLHYNTVNDLLKKNLQKKPTFAGHFGLNVEGNMQKELSDVRLVFPKAQNRDRVAAPDAPNVLIDLVEVRQPVIY